jgi:hypothetical protein
MRGFLISLALFGLLIVGFGVGLFGQAPGLVMATFCSGPFVLFALGWTTRGALNGKRFALVDDQSNYRQPVKRARAQEVL